MSSLRPIAARASLRWTSKHRERHGLGGNGSANSSNVPVAPCQPKSGTVPDRFRYFPPLSSPPAFSNLTSTSSAMTRQVEESRTGSSSKVLRPRTVLPERIGLETRHHARMSGAIPALAESRTTQLSRREIRVLEGVAEGLSNKQIGHLLGISEKTVRNHLSRIFEKLEANNRTQAVILAMSRGFESSSSPAFRADSCTNPRLIRFGRTQPGLTNNQVRSHRCRSVQGIRGSPLRHCEYCYQTCRWKLPNS